MRDQKVPALKQLANSIALNVSLSFPGQDKYFNCRGLFF